MASTDEIKKLREETGVSIMQCKKALEEAGGDMEKAKVILAKAGSAVAAKKGDRELGAGAIQSYIHSTNEVGAVVVLASETDFVSKNEEFVQVAYDIAMHVAATNPEFMSRGQLTDEDMKAAKEVFAQEVKDKPADLQDKILEGKLDSYFKDKILLEQDFIKDGDKTIQQLVDEATQKFGERIEIVRFERFSVKG